VGLLPRPSAPDASGCLGIDTGGPLLLAVDTDRPITPADLAALTERVRRRVIRWFRLARLLDAADMLAWENSGFSVDSSVRITLNRPRRAERFSESRAPSAILRTAAVGSPRGPPTDWGELMQMHDDRAIFQPSPDELPVIDIHSL
jgi:hypothetical protein